MNNVPQLCTTCIIYQIVNYWGNKNDKSASVHLALFNHQASREDSRLVLVTSEHTKNLPVLLEQGRVY